MKKRTNNIDALVRQVSEKAKELQNLTESVDFAKREIVGFVERKQRLVNEFEKITKEIEEKQRHYEDVVIKEQTSLASLEGEIAEKKTLLAELGELCVSRGLELADMDSVMQERKAFLEKAAAARVLYLEWQKKFRDVQEAFQNIEKKNAAHIAEIKLEKNELGQYKNYLMDFYGKVATYTKTAKETVEFVNTAIAEQTLIYFIPPSEPLTMDNFNKV